MKNFIQLIKEKKQFISIFIGILVVSILMWNLSKKRSRSPEEGGFSKYAPGNKEACPGETLTVKISDRMLEPVLHEGEEVKATMNWYVCNEIEHNDFVLYSFSNMRDPVVRIARGIAGDHFDLKKDKEHKSWNLYINDDVVTSFNKPYFFGSSEPPTLALYIEPRKGVIGSGEAIVLSYNPPGFADSGMFGIVSLRDILGKVELNDEQKSRFEATEKGNNP